MKVRLNRPSAERIILCHGYPEDRLERLRNAAQRKKFTVRVLSDADLCKKVGDILAGTGEAVGEAKQPVNTGVQMLLFSPMPKKELFDMLDALNANDANTPYKAMIGPINTDRQLDSLIADIMREHAQLHGLADEKNGQK